MVTACQHQRVLRKPTDRLRLQLPSVNVEAVYFQEGRIHLVAIGKLGNDNIFNFPVLVDASYLADTTIDPAAFGVVLLLSIIICASTF